VAVGTSSGQGRYTVADPVKYPLQSVIDEFKREVLEKGGAPEAVDALHAVVGFSKKELEVIKNVMAEKLSKKPVPAKAAKEPKAKAATGKPKGNTEALAKAREERAAKAAENRKYKHAVKLKDISLREGSWTARMVEIIMSHTTTDDAKAALAKDKEFSEKKLDFTWAAQKGYITF
jgi:predicted transcriptional regulator